MLESDGEAFIVPDDELPASPGKKRESAGQGKPGGGNHMGTLVQEG